MSLTWRTSGPGVLRALACDSGHLCRGALGGADGEGSVLEDAEVLHSEPATRGRLLPETSSAVGIKSQRRGLERNRLWRKGARALPGSAQVGRGA